MREAAQSYYKGHAYQDRRHSRPFIIPLPHKMYKGNEKMKEEFCASSGIFWEDIDYRERNHSSARYNRHFT